MHGNIYDKQSGKKGGPAIALNPTVESQSEKIQAQFDGLVNLFDFFFAESAYPLFKPFLVNRENLAGLDRPAPRKPRLGVRGQGELYKKEKGGTLISK